MKLSVKIFLTTQDDDTGFGGGMVVRTGNKSGSIGGFLKRTQRTLLDTPWQIIQVMETGQPGNFNVPKLILFGITL